MPYEETGIWRPPTIEEQNEAHAYAMGILGGGLDLVGETRTVAPTNGKTNGSAWPHVIVYDAGEEARMPGLQHEFVPFFGQSGYVIKGWSHLLAGYPRAGKTELLVALCRQWCALGWTILYITEEPQPLFRGRLARLPNSYQGMKIIYGLGLPVSEMMACACARNEQLVITDTARAMGLLGNDENDAARIAYALTPWLKAMRDAGKTWIATGHSRKGGGDNGEGIAGSHAIMGHFDMPMEYKRSDRNNVRTLKCWPRGLSGGVQSPDLSIEMSADGTLSLVGQSENITRQEVRQRIRSELGTDWVSTKSILETWEGSKPCLDTLRLALKAEAEEEQIERDPPLGEPVMGKQVKWRRVH